MKHIMRIKALLILISAFTFVQCQAQTEKQPRLLAGEQEKTIYPGAHQMDEYLPLLKGKNVAIIGNQTAEINRVLLPDTLLSLGVNVVKLFSPEHGFRGEADAGAKVANATDSKTGLPIFSLYGNNKKLPVAQLKGVDVVIYDLQDVGARFYTYISTLEYAMESCAQAGVELMILDRPNPLGFIVDGPILKKKSFVGMQPIPIIYGMTPGEYAQMLIGEKWIQAANLKLSVIKVKNYTHNSKYEIPVSPSPNLKNMAAIYLYPSLCLFEGTDISLGRGTTKPFQQFGHPSFAGKSKWSYTFKPVSMKGATSPPHVNKTCGGVFISDNPEEALAATQNRLNLEWLLSAYQSYSPKAKFFNNFFNTLAGGNQLKSQIEQGWTEEKIRASWQEDLNKFKKIRKKYLLYQDFE